VLLVHGVRRVDELAYHDLLTEHLPTHEFIGDVVSSQLRYYPTVTREPYRNMGRITELMGGGRLFEDLQVPPLNAETDRVMICGSPAMLRDLKRLLEERGFHEGSTSSPGAFVIERAFAEQ
jgi:ferredoxin/flavodoxin---NADP+ reductase